VLYHISKFPNDVFVV